MIAGNINEFQRLVDQAGWANHEWIEFVYSQSDPEIRPRELLGHMMISERIWFERIEGSQKTQTFFPLLDKEELLQNFQKNRQIYKSLIDGRLQEIIHFKRNNGDQYQARIADILHHLITHGYHHRGQLAAHYARKGVKYPGADHIDYLITNRL
jgi:uncharacterized damage-inducible protein DinB